MLQYCADFFGALCIPAIQVSDGKKKIFTRRHPKEGDRRLTADVTACRMLNSPYTKLV